MKHNYKHNLIKILSFLVCIVVVIFIIIYLCNKYNKTYEKFETTNSNSNYSLNDNYFNVDTINKITNSNLLIPKVKENTYKMMPGTILPYYGDFTVESVIELINNNYLPCDDGKIVSDTIDKTSKNIGFGIYKGINIDNSSAFYTINKSLTEQITVPDLRRMYLAGAGGKINTITNDTHSSFNSEDEYIKGKIIGEELHKLTDNELPAHKHLFKNYYWAENSWWDRFNIAHKQSIGNINKGVNSQATGFTDRDTNKDVSAAYIYSLTETTTKSNTDLPQSNTGSNDKQDISSIQPLKNAEHENRPPTVIINYIMYVGELPNKN